MVMIEKTIAEELARLFKDNMQKLHRLPESVILNRGSQFVTGLTRELNKMLEIETKLFTAYYSQTDEQMERTNQELEQYLRMYIDHRQSNQSEQLAMVEFIFNNKVYIFTKSSLFKINYKREPRMSFDIRKKRKNVKIEEFVKEMKDRYREAKAVLIKSQKKMKRQADRNRKEAEKYKVEDKVLISIRDFLIE